MATRIDLNADMGEGFGVYTMGHDEALLETVTSANVACGFHAGDPKIMHRLVTLAAAKGVNLGAHPGFDDLAGFGRRRIEMSLDEIEYLVAYQIGALAAMAAYGGIRLGHVKAHGALNNIAAENLEVALAIGRAIKTVDANLIYVVLSGSEMERAGKKLGLVTAREGFCDRLYEDDGNLTPRRIAGAVISDPELAAQRAVQMALAGEVVSRSGQRIRRQVETICIHGDAPTAVAVARAVRRRLQESAVEVVALTGMGLG